MNGSVDVGAAKRGGNSAARNDWLIDTIAGVDADGRVDSGNDTGGEDTNEGADIGYVSNDADLYDGVAASSKYG